MSVSQEGPAHDDPTRRNAEAPLRESIAELEAIFRAFPDLYFRVDAADRIVTYQAGRATDLYVPPEQFLGRRMQDVLPADVAHAFEETIRAARTSGAAGTEYSLPLPGGEKWFEARIVKMAGGHVLVIVRDITAQRKAREAIRRSAERLEHFQEIDRAILVARSVEDVARFALARLRHLVPCEVAGVWVRDGAAGPARPIAKLPVPEPSGPERAFFAGDLFALLDGPPQAPYRYFEDLGAAKPGPALAERAAAAGIGAALLVPLKAEGELIGILGLASTHSHAFDPEHVEIATELGGQLAIALHQERMRRELGLRAAELERRVEERTAELTAANEELESFSYSVTHDLRAPLRAMEGFARALLEDHAAGLDHEGRRYADRIVTAALRLDLVVQDLLRYSRLRRAEIRLKPVSLESVVAEVVAARETAIEAAGASVEVGSPLPDALAHRPTLVQIVENLLDNALKFVARGVAPRVRIRAEASSGAVRLCVEDNGIGIAPEDRERIFNVFERLHGVETYPGTGIGLAIVRKAAERMGGRAGVEPAPDEGSRFWVELAAHAAGTPADEGGEPASGQRRAGP